MCLTTHLAPHAASLATVTDSATPLICYTNFILPSELRSAARRNNGPESPDYARKLQFCTYKPNILDNYVIYAEIRFLNTRFSFVQNHGVELRHSTRNVSRIRHNGGNGLNTRFRLSCYLRDTACN